MTAQNESVVMRHPTHDQNGRPGECTREQFNEIWAPKGWVEVPRATAVAADVLGKPVDNVRSLSKDELVAVAATSGIALTGSESKAQLADLIEASATESEAAHG